MSDAKTFLDYASGDPLDQLTGDGEDVILGAYTTATAQTLQEADLLPDGIYPVHSASNEYRVGVQIKDGKRHILFQVFDHVVEAHKERLKQLKEQWAGSEEGPIYDVPNWLVVKMAMEDDVHPYIDEDEFEKVLAAKYPDCWIKPNRMPQKRKLII